MFFLQSAAKSFGETRLYLDDLQELALEECGNAIYGVPKDQLVDGPFIHDIDNAEHDKNRQEPAQFCLRRGERLWRSLA